MSGLTKRPTPRTNELAEVDAPSFVWKQSHAQIEQQLGATVEALGSALGVGYDENGWQDLAREALRYRRSEETMSKTLRTGVFNATESEKRDAFEWLRARALAGERRAGIMFEELAAAQAAFRTIEQALLPDPQDERELSVEWLRKVIHAAIDEARKPWVLWDN